MEIFKKCKNIKLLHTFSLITIGVCLGGLITYQLRNINGINLCQNTTTVSEIKTNDHNSTLMTSDLKREHFDDLSTVWGSFDSDTDTYTTEVFSTEYSYRSRPTSITHEIDIVQSITDIIPIKRKDIIPPFGEPEGPNKGAFLPHESEAIDHNYLTYGELLGGYFSSQGQEIYSVNLADVNSDGLEEKLIITGQIGGNHPPNWGYIVENNTIIATTYFASGSIYAAKDGNGFYVVEPDYSDTPLCCPNKEIIYRVVYEDNKFIPVWEQVVNYIKFD